MNIVIWLREGTWEACVDAAADLAPAGAALTLLHVIDAGPGQAVRGAHGGLMGRAHPGGGPADAVDRAAVAAQAAMLEAAGERLRRPARRDRRRGRAEREVLAACQEADLLIMARETDHPGPRGIGHAGRFVLDHAPCRVLLVRPGLSR